MLGEHLIGSSTDNDEDNKEQGKEGFFKFR